MMARLPHAHRADDLASWPRVTGADVRAGLWLIAFALLFLAITSVDYPVAP